jgi:hypothetical protein
MISLTDREKAIIVVTATISAVFGVWFGLWSVPGAALDVPKEMGHNGELSPAYVPVPTWLPFLSGLAVLVSLVGARNILRDPDEPGDEGDTVAADGGEVSDGQ